MTRLQLRPVPSMPLSSSDSGALLSVTCPSNPKKSSWQNGIKAVDGASRQPPRAILPKNTLKSEGEMLSRLLADDTVFSKGQSLPIGGHLATTRLRQQLSPRRSRSKEELKHHAMRGSNSSAPVSAGFLSLTTPMTGEGLSASLNVPPIHLNDETRWSIDFVGSQFNSINTDEHVCFSDKTLFDMETLSSWDQPPSEGRMPHTPLSKSTMELSPLLSCEQEFQSQCTTGFLCLGEPTNSDEFPLTKDDESAFVQSESHKRTAGGSSTANVAGYGGNSHEKLSLVEFTGKEPVPPTSKRSSERLVPIVQAPTKRQRVLPPLDHAIHMSESIDDDNATIKGVTSYFACPFYRNNAVRHTACLNLKMVRIRDVKQHLQRRHSEPRHYCPTCYKRFKTYLELSQHVQNQSIVGCSPKDKEFDFVPPHAKDLLKFKVSRKDSAEEQWYTVWDKIFKPKPRPNHPYMGTVIEEVTIMLQEYWQREGDQIVSSFMETQRVKFQDDVCLKEILHGLMNASYQMFGKQFRSSQPMERSVSSSSNEQQDDPEDQDSGALYDEDSEDFITTIASLDQKGFDPLSYELSSSHQALDEIEETTIWNDLLAETTHLEFDPAAIDFKDVGIGR